MSIEAKARNYIVAGCRPWNRRVFDEEVSQYPGKWYYFGSPEELNLETVRGIQPRYIFFLHWSWKVPEVLVENYECVSFHMTDLPFGRGGTPLQNLIIRGHSHTKISALRLTRAMDAGPVYIKEDLCMAGSAEEIYLRGTHIAAKIIAWIIREEPQPVAQTGEVTLFRRRQPKESEVPEIPTLQGLYDFLRMLDAEGYPQGFLHYKGFRFEFRRAALYNGRIEADVIISPLEKGNKNI